MRTSTRKTTTAALRALVGIKDLEMAEILKCSPNTIHSLEAGRLRLSDALGMRIAHETGVAIDWLLAGNPQIPPLDQAGQPYTTQTYEAWRTKRKNLVDPFQWELSLFQIKFSLGNFQRALRIILEAAHARREVPLAAYKISKALTALQEEFGVPSGAGADRPEVFMAALGSHSWTQHIATLRKKQFLARGKKEAVKPRSKSKRSSAKRKRRA